MSDKLQFDLSGEFETRNFKSCFARSVAVNSDYKSVDVKREEFLNKGMNNVQNKEVADVKMRKTKMQRGTVVAVGPGKRTEQGQLIPVNVKPGDEVILADYGGTKIELENDECFYLYRDTEILAKLKE